MRTLFCNYMQKCSFNIFYDFRFDALKREEAIKKTLMKTSKVIR